MTNKSFFSAFRMIPLLILLGLLLTGCGCKHEWNTATCTAPKTCSLCQSTEGDALGHVWKDATYTTPKSCSVCKATEGKSLSAKEAFAANPCKWLQGTWTGSISISGRSISKENFPCNIKVVCTVTFNSNGTYKETIKMGNEDDFIAAVEVYYEELFYEKFSSKGYNERQANEAMRLLYGMDIEDYAAKMAADTDWASLIYSSKNGVYFIEGNNLYMGSSWSSKLQPNEYTYSSTADCLIYDSLSKKYPTLLLIRS